jgi:His-Xaa-Ser system protein HxsD
VQVDLSLYDRGAVFRAAYQLSRRGACFLTRDPADERCLRVVLRPKAAHRGPGEACLVEDFANELIDQQLRADLARETAGVRELIVAQAFAEGNLLDPDRDEGDYEVDPRGIGRNPV